MFDTCFENNNFSSSYLEPPPNSSNSNTNNKEIEEQKLEMFNQVENINCQKNLISIQNDNFSTSLKNIAKTVLGKKRKKTIVLKNTEINLKNNFTNSITNTNTVFKNDTITTN